MGKIGFGGGTALIDGLAYLAAADAVHKAHGKRHNMVHTLCADIGLHPKRRQMGAEQPTDVDEHGCHCKQHRHPAVVGKVLRLREVWRYLQHLTDEPPNVDVGQQGDQCADGGYDP